MDLEKGEQNEDNEERKENPIDLQGCLSPKNTFPNRFLADNNYNPQNFSPKKRPSIQNPFYIKRPESLNVSQVCDSAEDMQNIQ